MPALSEALKLGWRLAAEEAVHAGQMQIDPTYLLIGICRIERVIREETWERYAVEANFQESIQQEWTEAAGAFSAAGIDAVNLRREVRAALVQNSMVLAANHVAKRSEATRKVFDRAEERAKRAGRPVTALNDALAVLVPSLNSEAAPLPSKIMTPLSKLESLLAPLPVAGVTLCIDAELEDTAEHLRNTGRDALFYDLPLLMASQPNSQALLDCVLAAVLKFFPVAERAAMLVRERASNRLVLQAHLPAGKPSASMELAEHVLKQNAALIWHPAASTSQEDVGARSMAEFQTACAMYAPLHWQKEMLGVLCVDTRNAASSFTPDDLRLFIAIAHHVALSIYSQRLTQDLQTQNLLLQRLLTHFSPKLRQRLVERASRGRLSLGGERSEVSILFSDIRGFTKMSAGMEPDDVVSMLNDYFAALVEAIFKQEGTVDKFIGDAILAVFGSPDPSPKHHEEALHAAAAMQSAMQKVNAARQLRGLPTCEIGIGLHSGEVLHGFVGTQERLEFTVVGDAVNRASRYCSAAGAGEILMSEEFHRHVWREIEVESREVPTKHEGTWPAFRLVKTKSPR
ncbi:MAG TPA: adenylate/guanylate cyclase domain-containing protein [Candidatus Acidoferrum sp.]